MLRSAEERELRKAAVLDALQALRMAFPLQTRIESAAPVARAAYAEVLRRWVNQGLPSGPEVAPAAALETLAGMDAIVIDDEGVGCYPFSARATGMRVDFAGRSVHAMCAVDALAIPHLVRHLGRVSARCVICHCHLACEITGHGELAQGAAQGLRVFWRRAAAGHGPCCSSLCSGIGFVCQHCTIGEEGLSLALPQALAVANAFFAFQRRLLEHYERL